MSENPYTRTARVRIVELVPAKGALPKCVAWKVDGSGCTFDARYEQNGEPVCGVHVGKPGLVFMPESVRSRQTG